MLYLCITQNNNPQPQTTMYYDAKTFAPSTSYTGSTQEAAFFAFSGAINQGKSHAEATEIKHLEARHLARCVESAEIQRGFQREAYEAMVANGTAIRMDETKGLPTMAELWPEIAELVRKGLPLAA